MDKITLGDIAAWLAFIVALGGSILAITAVVKKALKKMFKELLIEINSRLDEQEKTIKKFDLENCKNYLVQTLSAVDRGEQLTEIERIRLAEQFEHYTENGGNSYIKDWHARSKAAGKI